MTEATSVSALFDNLVARPLETLGGLVTLYLPRVLGALVVLGIGRIAAGLLRRLTRDVLRAAGLDVLMQRFGVTAALERGGVQRRPSELAGLVVFWMIMLSAFMLAFESMGLSGAALLLRAMVAFAPRIVVAVAMVALGLVVADHVGRIVERAAAAAGVPAAGLWGQFTRWGILGFAGVAILEELSVASQTLRLALFGLLAMGPVGAALAIGLGGQGIAREVLAGQVVRAAYRAGDSVEVDLGDGRTVRGQIEYFDIAATFIRPTNDSRSSARDAGSDPPELVSVPHSRLMSGHVTVVSTRQRAAAPSTLAGSPRETATAGKDPASPGRTSS